MSAGCLSPDLGYRGGRSVRGGGGTGAQVPGPRLSVSSSPRLPRTPVERSCILPLFQETPTVIQALVQGQGYMSEQSSTPSPRPSLCLLPGVLYLGFVICDRGISVACFNYFWLNCVKSEVNRHMIKAALERATVLFPVKGPDKTLRDGIIFSVSVPARLRLPDRKGRSRGGNRSK